MFPENSAPEDMMFVFDNNTVKMMQFEEAIYTDDIVTLQNVSMGNSMIIKVNWTTGLQIYEQGWYQGKMTETMFKKQNDTIQSVSMLELYPETPRNDTCDIFINASLPSPVDLYWAFLDYNPTFTPFIHSIPDMPLYLDLYSSSKATLDNYNITLVYDQTPIDNYGIPEAYLNAFAFNNSTQTWWEAPIGMTTLDTTTNTLTFNEVPSSMFSFFAIGVAPGWSYGVNPSDILIFEDNGTYTNETSGKVWDVVDLMIYNVTDVRSQEFDWLGAGQSMSTVFYDYLFYNASSQQLEKDPLTPTDQHLVSWGQNETDPIMNRFKLSEYSAGIPLVLPLKWGQLDLELIAPIMYETFFNTTYAEGTLGLPNWEPISANNGLKQLRFIEISNGYRMTLNYYDNGTLKDGSVYSQFRMGADIFIMDLTFGQRIDYNTTKTIDWNVTVGETYYYGDMHGEYRYQIIAINESHVEQYSLGTKPFPSWIMFTNIWATFWTWNVDSQSWEYNYTTIIGAANDYYLLGPGKYKEYFGIYDEKNKGFLCGPKGVTAVELADALIPMFSEMKLDTIEIADSWHFSIINSTGPNYLNVYYNVTTGTVLFIESYSEWSGGSDSWVFFAKHNVSLASGTNIFTITSEFITGINASMTMNTTAGSSFLYSGMNINPTNVTLNETGLFYLDFMAVDYAVISGTSIKVTLPRAINVETIAFNLWWWGIQNAGKHPYMWDVLSSEAIKQTIVNGTENSITIIFNSSPGPMVGILALSYNVPADAPKTPPPDVTPPPGAEIPGYDIWVMLSVIMMVSVIYIHKKRR